MKLSTFLNINNPEEFKIHTARINKKEGIYQPVEPLDVFVRDRKEWQGWNSSRRDKNDFNRKFILSLMQFYPENDTWLFGGIFQVLGEKSRNIDETGTYYLGYETVLTEQGAEFIGRLKVMGKISRGRAFLFPKLNDKLVISEILKEPYGGEKFVGYENVSQDFSRLQAIFKNEREDWKTALENVKGVYVIVDRKTGRKYVGSAYGETGIWARWANYLKTGHGFNKELIALLDGKDQDYARLNFRITLVECWPFKTDDQLIIQRESFWKNALLTRGEHGYNAN